MPGAPPRARRATARALLTAVTAVLSLVAGCERPSEPVQLRLQTEGDEWENLVDAHPLPPGFALVAVGDGSEEPGAALRLGTVVGPVRTDEADDAGPAERTISRRWLVPVAPLWATGTQVELVPIADARLPLAARAADGLYPHDPDYPYVEQLVLELDADATGLSPEDERRIALEAWFAGLPAADTSAPRVHWIAAVGDLMVARGVTELLDRPDGLELVFSDLLPYMQSADLLLGNLEGAVSRRGEPLEKTFTFRFHPRVLDPLARAGFDYLSIVNNHSYDYGEIGFLDSLDHLAAAGIATSGAGRSLADAREPYRTRVPEQAGTPVRVLAVGAYPLERSGFDGARQTAAGEDRPGVLWAERRNPEAHAQAIAAMRDAFTHESFDIVTVHGGPEWATRPPEWQRELYRSYVDAGADLVVGHHSHVVQGLETYRGALIAHSLGNYVFPGMFVTEHGEESLLLRVGLVGGVIRYVDPVAVRIDNQFTSRDELATVMPRFLAETRRLHEE